MSFNLPGKKLRKKLNGQGGVKVQLLTHLPPLLSPFEPHAFFQLSANSSSLVIPLLVLKCNSHAAQTTSPSRRLRFTPSKQTDMCFICRRGSEVLYLVTGAASCSILPSGKLTNYTALFISKKKTPKPKQLGILGCFQLSLLPSANVPCTSIQYKARASRL